MRLKQRLLLPALIVFLFLPALGCGRGKSSVSGTVTLDGKPLYMGMIVFIPEGAPAVSGEIKEGQYSVTGVPNGEASVTVDNKQAEVLANQAKKQAQVSAAPPQGTLAGKTTAGANMPPEAKAELEKQQQQMADAAKRNRDLAANFRPVPEKYADPKGSGLNFKVGSGSTYDISLTSK
jgi:hypothetical protein